MSAEFIDGSIGIYRPLMEFFDTPAYKQSVKTCWNAVSYKLQIGLLAEILRLQQMSLIPPEVTVEAMTDLLVEENKKSLRVKLWEFEMDDDFESEARLVFEVNTSMKMRDIEFEARSLLDCPEKIPLQLKQPGIVKKALRLAESWEHQHTCCSQLINVRDMVIKVVPKVLQCFWLPPPNTHFTMPSRCLSKMVAGVTHAVVDRVSCSLSSVQIHFSSSIRDNLVASIEEKVRQTFISEDLVENIHSYQPEFLSTITDVAVREICACSAGFVPIPPSPSPEQSSDTISLSEDGVSVEEEKESNNKDADDLTSEYHPPPPGQKKEDSSHHVFTNMSLITKLFNWMKKL
ncbi:uncharacterized protein [Nerophis lumbriciformis]|uniref:uncharacterized protein n=1 Tax=Nerophis lumbriciformis TaxID=546530 RepID=UPI003BAB02DA